VAGRDFRESLASEDLLRVLDRLRRAETGEETSFTIDCSLRPARAPWPIDVRLSASRTAYGGHPAVIGSVRDIGPDRDALRRVLVSEAKLDAAIEASEDAVLLLGSAPSGGTGTLGNHRFEELFGLSPRALAGLSLEGLAEALAPLFANPAEIRDYLRRLASGKDENPTLLLETIRPLRRVFEVSSRAARDRRGRVLGSRSSCATSPRTRSSRRGSRAGRGAGAHGISWSARTASWPRSTAAQKGTADVEQARAGTLVG
jgi:PAS domain-containing protein